MKADLKRNRKEPRVQPQPTTAPLPWTAVRSEDSPADNYNACSRKIKCLLKLIESADMEHLGSFAGEPAMPWIMGIAEEIIYEMDRAFTMVSGHATPK